MAPRGFTNPAPKTDSARSALSSFTCTLCNKSYSRHPEYEAHIGSYDHQHRKRLQDLKQLSRDPNAAERARKAARKADAEAGLVRVDSNTAATSSNTATTSSGGGGGGGFKKGGFKSSFTTVKGTAPATSVKKNVLGDDDDDEGNNGALGTTSGQPSTSTGTTTTTNLQQKDPHTLHDGESDTDDDYQNEANAGDAYYNPLRPTGCSAGCAGAKAVPAT